MNAFAALFNFIEKYAYSEKHTLENTLLFLREREREKLAMECEIYEVSVKILSIPSL